MGRNGKRYFVEIMEVEGHCQAQVGYSALPGGVVVWQTTQWQLPAETRSARQMVEELYDALTCLLELLES